MNFTHYRHIPQFLVIDCLRKIDGDFHIKAFQGRLLVREFATPTFVYDRYMLEQMRKNPLQIQVEP